MIDVSRRLPNNIKVIIDKVIQNNTYFAHLENYLMTMLTDTWKHIRELVVRRNLKSRKFEIKNEFLKSLKLILKPKTTLTSFTG